MTTGHEEIAEHARADEAHQDGIGEEDNAIPAWWWWSFFATVVFAAFYTPYFILGGWSQAGQYAEQVASAQAIAAAAPKVETNPFRGDAAALAEGKQVFETICAACHKPDASGLVGPSLVDPYWKYGHDDVALFETVAKGRPAGMPAWETQLGAEKIWKSLAYLESLPRTETPGLGAAAAAGDDGDDGAAAPAPPPAGG